MSRNRVDTVVFFSSPCQMSDIFILKYEFWDFFQPKDRSKIALEFSNKLKKFTILQGEIKNEKKSPICINTTATQLINLHLKKHAIFLKVHS